MEQFRIIGEEKVMNGDIMDWTKHLKIRGRSNMNFNDRLGTSLFGCLPRLGIEERASELPVETIDRIRNKS